MQLDILIEDTGEVHALQAGNTYIAGSKEHCDIYLSQAAVVSEKHLKFSYEGQDTTWNVQEISGTDNTFINGKPLSQYKPIIRYPIGSQTRISIGGSVVLIATPKESLTTLDLKPPPKISAPASSKISTPTRTDTLLQSSANTRIQETKPSSIESIGVPNAGTTSSSASSFIDGLGALPIVNLGFRWFKIGAPEDGIGLQFRRFNLHQTYRIEKDKVNLDQLCNKLYAQVYRAVNDGTLGDARVRPLIYRKKTVSESDSRKYILVTRDTRHGNRTTVLVRFLEYGENLYVGLEVYSLGQVSLFKLLKKVAITSILLALSFTVIPLFIIPVLWWKLVWRAIYEKNIWLAVRQEFPGQIGGGPFDYDDVFMFSKSTVALVTKTIRHVFEEEGLPLEALDNFIQQINNTVNVSTEGGAISMVGSAIGAGNTIE